MCESGGVSSLTTLSTQAFSELKWSVLTNRVPPATCTTQIRPSSPQTLASTPLLAQGPFAPEIVGARMHHSVLFDCQAVGSQLPLDGDTQIMPSQIYKDYTVFGPLNAARVALLDGRDDAETDVEVSRRLNEGDTGYVEVRGNYDQRLSKDELQQHISADDENEVDNDELATDAKEQPNRIYPPRRSAPETPASVLGKRTYNGEIISSDIKTPGSRLSAFFGGYRGATMLGLTQVFHQTQASASPLPDGLRSDSIFERPSPRFADFRHSSPVLMMSSAVRPARAQLQRALTEPRDHYMSMKESQALRETHTNWQCFPRSQGSATAQERQEADQIDSDENRVGRPRKIARIDLEAETEFVDLTGRHKPRSRRLKARPISASSALGLVTPAPAKIKERDVLVISDDVHADESPDSGEGSIEEYDELSQDIVRTSRRNNVNGKEERVVSHNVVREGKLPKTPASGHGGGSFEHCGSCRGEINLLCSPYLSATPCAARGEPLVRTEMVAVANSQPTDSETPYTLPPCLIHPSSADSRLFVSQSQGNRVRLPVPELRFPARSESFCCSSSARSRLEGNLAQQWNLKHAVDKPAAMLQSSPLIVRSLISKDALQRDAEVGPDVMVPPAGEPPKDFAKPTAAELVNMSRSGEERNSNLEMGVKKSFVGAAGGSDITGSTSCDWKHPGMESSSAAQTSSITATEQAAVLKVQKKDVHTPSDDTHGQNDRKAPVEATAANNSNSDGFFETARTHPCSSTGETKMQRVDTFANTRSLAKDQLKTFTEIAAESTPSDAVREIDFESQIMSGEDLIFQAVMSGSSPTALLEKSRKVQSRTVSEEPYQGTVHSCAIPTRPLKPLVRRDSDPLTPSVSPVRSAVSSPKQSDKLRGQALSPMPPPGRKENGAGAGIAVQSRHRSFIKKPTRAWQYGKPLPRFQREITELRMAVRRSQQKPALHLVEPRKAPAKLKHNAVISPDTHSQPESAIHSNLGDLYCSHVGGRAENRPATDNGTGRSEAEMAAENSSQEMSAPRRVFALFKGGRMLFWPATFVGRAATDGSRYKVCFDDQTASTVEPHHVCRLDLRLGDFVKVDLNNMRTKTYVVCGFRDQVIAAGDVKVPNLEPGHSLADRQNEFTDIQGHKTVILRARQQESFHPDNTCTVDVPVSSIYLTQTMWARFMTRKIPVPLITDYTDVSGCVNKLPAYPALSSRSRRCSSSGMDYLGSCASRSESALQDRGLFAGMAFAVSYSRPVTDTPIRDAVTKCIVANGGRLLEAGFDVLFHIPGEDPPHGKVSTAETDTAGRTVVLHARLASTLKATKEAKALGFAALIGDKYSRTVKYMQALALGLPCLSGRWITDSAKKGDLLPWERYLLPAGESTALAGAVRSRTLTPYDPRSARLVDVVEARDKILSGRNVLVVMGKGKAEARRRAYLFVTYALGAGRVGRVRNLAEAREAILQQRADLDGSWQWDWVYIEGKERKAGILTGELAAKVVEDEFIVQSLILGAVLETD